MCALLRSYPIVLLELFSRHQETRNGLFQLRAGFETPAGGLGKRNKKPVLEITAFFASIPSQRVRFESAPASHAHVECELACMDAVVRESTAAVAASLRIPTRGRR